MSAAYTLLPRRSTQSAFCWWKKEKLYKKKKKDFKKSRHEARGNGPTSAASDAGAPASRPHPYFMRKAGHSKDSVPTCGIYHQVSALIEEMDSLKLCRNVSIFQLGCTSCHG